MVSRKGKSEGEKTMEKHYEFTDEAIDVMGHILHRIRATKDLPNGVNSGELGGFVESFDNLSDNAWVHGNAKVYGNAKVFGNALICRNAEVYGNAKVYGNAAAYDSAWIFGNAKVFDYAAVYRDAEVSGNAQVYGNAKVCRLTRVSGNATVFGDVRVHGDEVWIRGNAQVCNDADYIVFKNWWSSGRYFTWTRSNNMWSVGCFYGTGEELVKKAYADTEVSGREYARVVKYVESIVAESK